MDHAADIDRLHAVWGAAIRAGDVERALALLTDDYELWAAGAPAVVGRDAVRRLFGAALAAYDIEPAFESEERMVSGDLAVERGCDVQTIRPRDGGEARTMRQRVFLVLRRDRDGVWRYARGMSQPEPEPDQR